MIELYKSAVVYHRPGTFQKFRLVHAVYAESIDEAMRELHRQAEAVCIDFGVTAAMAEIRIKKEVVEALAAEE